jgi:hypothetical protein
MMQRRRAKERTVVGRSIFGSAEVVNRDGVESEDSPGLPFGFFVRADAGGRPMRLRKFADASSCERCVRSIISSAQLGVLFLRSYPLF